MSSNRSKTLLLAGAIVATTAAFANVGAVQAQRGPSVQKPAPVRIVPPQHFQVLRPAPTISAPEITFPNLRESTGRAGINLWISELSITKCDANAFETQGDC